MPVELGLLFAPQKKLASIVEAVVLCTQQLEPDHIWVCDRLLSNFSHVPTEVSGLPVPPPSEFLDPFLTLAALAKSGSEHPEFGIAVTDLVRRAPPDLARACNTIAQIIGRPLHLGLGSGEAVNLKPLGYGQNQKPVSFFEQELRRFVGINRDGVCHSQDHVVALGYNREPAKIWIGGQRTRMLGLTARYADGWLPAWKMSAEEYAEKKLLLARMAADHRRPCPKPGMFAGVMLGESRRAVLRAFDDEPMYKFWALELPAELWRRWGLRHPAGDDSKGTPDVVISELPVETLRGLAALVPSELIAEMCFFGNVAEVLEELWAYRKAGMEHITLMVPLSADGEANGAQGDDFARFIQLCHELKRW